MSFVDDLNNLDPNNPGLWPKPVQIVLFLLLFCALLFAGWKFDITKKRDELAGLQSDKVKVNSPMISRVVPSTISKPEFKNCFGAR